MKHELRRPTPLQVKFARDLGLEVEGRSFRVISALIADELELKAFRTVEAEKIYPGDRVVYAGPRDDMPKELVVRSVSSNGYLFFRNTNKYCRPWFVKAKQPAARRKGQ